MSSVKVPSGNSEPRTAVSRKRKAKKDNKTYAVPSTKMNEIPFFASVYSKCSEDDAPTSKSAAVCEKNPDFKSFVADSFSREQ